MQGDLQPCCQCARVWMKTHLHGAQIGGIEARQAPWRPLWQLCTQCVWMGWLQCFVDVTSTIQLPQNTGRHCLISTGVWIDCWPSLHQCTPQGHHHPLSRVFHTWEYPQDIA